MLFSHNPTVTFVRDEGVHCVRAHLPMQDIEVAGPRIRALLTIRLDWIWESLRLHDESDPECAVQGLPVERPLALLDGTAAQALIDDFVDYDGFSDSRQVAIFGVSVGAGAGLLSKSALRHSLRDFASGMASPIALAIIRNSHNDLYVYAPPESVWRERLWAAWGVKFARIPKRVPYRKLYDSLEIMYSLNNPWTF